MSGENPGKIFWGTLHNHSTISWDVFRGSPSKIYRLNKAQGLDFCSITDHDSPFGVGDSQRRWQKSVRRTEEFNQPHEFVTFIGYEWTSGQGPPFYPLTKNYLYLRNLGRFNYSSKFWGHKNVYFPGGEASIPKRAFSWNQRGSDTPVKLWGKIEPYGGMTITHHPLGGPTPAATWEDWDPQREPLVEIFSIHGNSETEDCRYRVYKADLDGTHSVRYALGKGFRLGFVAGTDSHCYLENALGQEAMWLNLTKFISGNPEVPAPGLTGVYAEELTREGLWQAFFARRTFATTGAKIKVYFSVEDTFMGGFREVVDEPELQFAIAGTSPLARVEIIKNGQVIEVFDLSGSKEVKRSFVDTSLLSDYNYYYLRVFQGDGHMAWSSPVWLAVPEKFKNLWGRSRANRND